MTPRILVSEPTEIEIVAFLESKTVPRRTLSLRHCQAKYLLELVARDRRMMEGGYTDKTHKMMVDALGDQLMQIERELR